MNSRKRPLKHRTLPYIVAAVAWMFFSYLLFFIIPNEQTVISLASEDGVFETAGAFLFLFTSILFFTAFLRSKKQSQLFKLRTIVFLLLSLLFLFGFFEEISWGQRFFGIATPEALTGVNKQQELNIHNLAIFHSLKEDGERKTGLALLLSTERLFSAFWLSFCCLIPLLHKLKSPIQKTLDFISFPIVPLSLGLLFAVNHLATKIVSPQLSEILRYPLVEVKECAFAFLFFTVGLWFVNNRVIKRPDRLEAVQQLERLPVAPELSTTGVSRRR